MSGALGSSKAAFSSDEASEEYLTARKDGRFRSVSPYDSPISEDEGGEAGYPVKPVAFECATVIGRNTLKWVADLACEADATYERDEYVQFLPKISSESPTVAFVYDPSSFRRTTVTDRDGGDYLAPPILSSTDVFRTVSPTHQQSSDDDSHTEKRAPDESSSDENLC